MMTSALERFCESHKATIAAISSFATAGGLIFASWQIAISNRERDTPFKAVMFEKRLEAYRDIHQKNVELTMKGRRVKEVQLNYADALQGGDKALIAERSADFARETQEFSSAAGNLADDVNSYFAVLSMSELEAFNAFVEKGLPRFIKLHGCDINLFKAIARNPKKPGQILCEQSFPNEETEKVLPEIFAFDHTLRNNLRTERLASVE